MKEISALDQAKKDNINEIVDYFGAKLEGRTAHIFMEFMKGEKKKKTN